MPGPLPSAPPPPDSSAVRGSSRIVPAARGLLMGLLGCGLIALPFWAAPTQVSHAAPPPTPAVIAPTPASPPTPLPAAPPATAPTTRPTTRTAEQKKQDDIRKVMEFFRITQPDVYEQALSLRDTDPDKFEKLIRGAIKTVDRLEYTRQKNPKLFELCMEDLQLNYRSLRIAHDLQRPDLPESDRQQFLMQLKRVVSTEFELQQQIKHLEIEDLRKKVSDLDSAVHARQEDKDNVIRKRIDDLTQRTPRLEW